MTRRLVIHPQNLAPNFSWFHTAWLLALTVKAFDLGDWAVYASIMYVVLQLGGWIWAICNIRMVDIFKPLKSKDD